MHSEVLNLLTELRSKYPKHFDSSKVIEFGSRDMNGSPRSYVTAPKEYLGIDFRSGKGVDIVGICHEFKSKENHYDMVVSTEMLEHDPYWKNTLQHACRLLRSGGLIVVTCGAPSRQEHNQKDSPIPGYYENRSAEDIEDCLTKECNWSELSVKYQRDKLDLFCVGVKA